MRLHGALGLGILFGSGLGLYAGVEPFPTWFYCFAWWSYILVADNLVLKLRGTSLLTGRLGEFFAQMVPLSVLIWLLFEGYNLTINNWSYQDLPAERWLRWPGYFLSFATVLPAVFVTTDLLGTLFFSEGKAEAPSEITSQTAKIPVPPSRVLTTLGIFLSIAPLFWPRIFFATVWIGPIFILDPLLERFGLQSLSLSLQSGKRWRIWSLMIAGLGCGLLWELWNFWATSKWVYTLPFLDYWRLFEMPVLGFLGFPPFALECWILYHLCGAILGRCRSPLARVGVWTLIATLCLTGFWLIDQMTWIAAV